MKVQIPVSIGELFDKISILEIKKEKIKNHQKAKNIEHELDCLRTISRKNKVDKISYLSLKKINSKIWEMENEIRKKEYKRNFDQDFIELARNIYILNDLRAKTKREMNLSYNSEIIEEKSYSNY